MSDFGAAAIGNVRIGLPTLAIRINGLRPSDARASPQINLTDKERTSLRIDRVWAMPSKWTFDVAEIKSLVRKYAGGGSGWADPFAGQSSFAEHRNDLNPANSQPHCMEAADFMARFADHSLLGVIFDPPYSVTQVKISYETMGYKFNGKENPTGGFPLVRDHIRRTVRPEGYVISFGWNTAGVGINRDFDIKEILIVAHGGNRNDTLCTVEQKSSQIELSL